MATDNTPIRSTTELEITRHAFGGSGHWGSTGYKEATPKGRVFGGVSPEAMLDRLLEGTRIRVTVEVLDEAPLTDAHGAHRSNPSPRCEHCLSQHPELFVVLACGHGRHRMAWERDGKPATMECWDGWAPDRSHGMQTVVSTPAGGGARTSRAITPRARPINAPSPECRRAGPDVNPYWCATHGREHEPPGEQP